MTARPAVGQAPVGSSREPATASLFAERWWLDAVAPGAWSEARVHARDGRVVAALPYVLRRRSGLTISDMPELTQTLGPWVRTEQLKYAERLSAEHRLLDALIDALPEADWFCQHFHHSVTNWLPFAWRGFQASPRYTYVVDGLDDLERVWSELRSAARTQVRKARRRAEVQPAADVDEFLELHRATFARQSLAVPWSLDTVRAVIAAATERAQGRLTFALDAQGTRLAGAFCVWDDRATYYLLGGQRPRLRDDAAMSLLIWDAIAHAAETSSSFDFEGTMLRHVEPFFRGFGARQRPYFRVWRASEALLRRAGGADPAEFVSRLRGA